MALIAIVAFVGTINPSGGDLGMLLPWSMRCWPSTVFRNTGKTFPRYSLIGALATAAGSLAASFPDVLIQQGIAQLSALKIMFYLYAAFGLGSGAIYLWLPHAAVENTGDQVPLGPSRGRIYKLAALFSMDAFAGGFTVQSLLALWLFERFDLRGQLRDCPFSGRAR